jgi:hypothetical protein
VSGLHHVGVRPRSLRYYTTERHSVIDSALHPIADMCGALANVRFGPIADIGINDDLKLCSVPVDVRFGSDQAARRIAWPGKVFVSRTPS